MIPECLQNVLKDIGIYDEQKSVVERRLMDDTAMYEKINVYIHSLAEDDNVYERFMTFLRVYQQPLQALLPCTMVTVPELIQVLQYSIDEPTIHKKLTTIIYFALGTIPSSVIALRRRRFNLEPNPHSPIKPI